MRILIADLDINQVDDRDMEKDNAATILTDTITTCVDHIDICAVTAVLHRDPDNKVDRLILFFDNGMLGELADTALAVINDVLGVKPASTA